MAETIEELKAELKAAGWRIDKKPIRSHTDRCDWYAWQPKRPDEWPNCDCNDKPPSLTLQPSCIEVNDRLHTSVEFDLCGDKHGVTLLVQDAEPNFTPQPTQAQAGAVPLTEAQRNAIWEEHRYADGDGWVVDCDSIIDAVEAAHGIKGADHA